MKKIIFLTIAVLGLIACEPRIEMDRSQWDLEAEITDVFVYTWQQDEVTLPDGSKVMGTKKVTVSSAYDVDSENATITITLKDGTERSQLSAYFYHTGKAIEPLDNSPKLGELADWSSDTYKYRVVTEGKLYKDWVVTIQ
ncbi:MAG: hypothetical protein N4A74_26235 [Carboxylicivirga sp.]|jgi:hypothetical protein|nr:hypothetical protein [Carboxylicivirga sp.]